MPRAVAVGPLGDVLVTGGYKDSLRIGKQPLESAGIEKTFLATLRP